MSASLPDVPRLLREYGLRPEKKLGQNFLIEPHALQDIAEGAQITKHDWVLEIGPGLGSLTCLLAELASQVIAVEIDPQLMQILRKVVAQYPNVRLIQGDILGLDPVQLIKQDLSPNAGVDAPLSYLVVANIPYYITSALIRHLLEARLRPSRMVLTVQREVAERIVAEPGELSLLALSVQVYGTPKITARIPAGAFYPSPQVDSAVVRVDIAPTPRIPPAQLPIFFHLAKAGFSQKRKTLRNALAGGMAWEPQRAAEILRAVGIDSQRRAETLSLEEWSRLTAFVADILTKTH